MKKGLLFLSFALYLFNSAVAQKQGNIWCFGANAGLNFNSGTPVCFSGVAMNQWEGCSSIADSSGNLLFYTDGNSVWNKNNLTMPNGTGLLANNSSTQAALIVKQPGNTNIYYVFTTDAFQGPNGFKYSIVDMNLQSGLGDVTVKNSNILPVCDERVAAIHHGNGTDVWVLTTTGNTDTIQIFLLTAAGFDTVPATVYVSGIKHGQSFQGYLKPSPDGSKLAIAYFNGGFDLFDFDRCTGLPSNPIALKSNNYWSAYGVEFSPDETKLYGVLDEGYDIYQWDLSVGWDSASIAGSLQIVGMSSDIDLGALQLGPDGKIYLARIYTSYLGVINNPNVSGAGCNFVDSGLYLEYGSSNIGLPNIFIPVTSADTSGAPVANFIAGDTSFCAGAPVSFANLSTGAMSYQWNFPGATPDTSTSQNPVNILYQNPGTYNVSLVAFTTCGTNTLVKNNYIHVYPSPVPPALSANDTVICANDSTKITASGSYNQYLWNTGSTENYTYATAAGGYWVTVTDTGGCATVSQHINIGVYPVPSVSIIEQGDTLTSFGAVAYQWYFNDSVIQGANSPLYIASQPGSYAVEITDSNGCMELSSNTYVSTTGISRLTNNLALNIYPNPANGQVHIVNSGAGYYTLFNAVGQEIKSFYLSAADNLVRVTDLPNGVYLVVNGNNFTEGQKLVIER